MTIAQLIEILCGLVGEMASVIDQLSLRLLQTGNLTEGEALHIHEIEDRIRAIGISPPSAAEENETGSGDGRRL